MILSDRDIRRAAMGGGLRIQPYSPELVQSSSLDVRLGEDFRRLNGDASGIVDLSKPVEDITSPAMTNPVDGSFLLSPQEFALAHTLETIGLPGDIGATVEGKSSLGRVGLIVHVTAGYIDPGFNGQITLELYNMSNRTFRLTPGQKIAQLSFFMTSTPVENSYGSAILGSRYQHQTGATSSRLNHGEHEYAGD